MFKKIKELKLKVIIIGVTIGVLFVTSVVCSIYSTIKLHLVEQELNELYNTVTKLQEDLNK